MPSSHYSHSQYPPVYEAPSLSLSAVLYIVFAGLTTLYVLIASLVPALSPFAVVLKMAGVLFGPQARETLASTFNSSAPAAIATRVRNRAASLIPDSDAGAGSGVVGGLWNMGNTCYQNSVLQALASLESLAPYLEAIEAYGGSGTAEALADLLHSLNILGNRRTSTPAEILTRKGGGRRWAYGEQEDAQEFFLGLIGALEKEASSALSHELSQQEQGLRLPDEDKPAMEQRIAKVAEALSHKEYQNPFEGLYAQRVACRSCSYVASISYEPFTTLSVPIPSTWSASLDACIRSYTTIEEIPGVDCDKCTLLALRNQLTTLLPTANDAFRPLILSRLQAVQQALEDESFSPPPANINLKSKTSSTKTKQVMIARSPKILVIHTNRSEFDMRTGYTVKNHASVTFGRYFVLPCTNHEDLETDPDRPMSRHPETVVYELRSVVAHFGGHHNGHYVTYRRTEAEDSKGQEWWRISDHNVSRCGEEEVLDAGNAFMLFFERLPEGWVPPRPVVAEGSGELVAMAALPESASESESTEVFMQCQETAGEDGEEEEEEERKEGEDGEVVVEREDSEVVEGEDSEAVKGGDSEVVKGEDSDVVEGEEKAERVKRSEEEEHRQLLTPPPELELESALPPPPQPGQPEGPDVPAATSVTSPHLPSPPPEEEPQPQAAEPPKPAKKRKNRGKRRGGGRGQPTVTVS